MQFDFTGTLSRPFTRRLSFISGKKLTGQDYFLLVYHFLHQKYVFGIFPFSFNGNEEQARLRCCQLSQFHHKPHYLCVFLKPQDSGWKKTKTFLFHGTLPLHSKQSFCLFHLQTKFEECETIIVLGLKSPKSAMNNPLFFFFFMTFSPFKGYGDYILVFFKFAVGSTAKVAGKT